MPKPKVLILGGTHEAVWLAEQLTHCATVVYSLAGKTIDPALPKDCTIRCGGFGGEAGLAAHIRQEAYDALIDATHPFARIISQHATAACRKTGVALFPFHRVRWEAQDGDDWHGLFDMTQLLQRLDQDFPSALVTFGQRNLEPFAALKHTRLLLRMVHPPQRSHFFHEAIQDATSRHTILCRRPPYGFDFECGLIQDHGLKCLVTRNSGGIRPAKLDAAARYGLPVLMLEDQHSNTATQSPMSFLNAVRQVL